MNKTNENTPGEKTATPIEIEHKYLIARPDPAVLTAQPGARVLEIEQIYLRSAPGVTRRVRRICENGEVHYYRTEKRRISALSAYEDEREITREEYSASVREADPHRRMIRKTRYKIPYCGFVCEIDVYPFWRDRAILEIEVPDEHVLPPLPAFVTVMKDVTADRRYKNASLAKGVIPADTRRAVQQKSRFKQKNHRKMKR